MEKFTVRLRSLLDLAVTLMLGAVAVLMLWRMTTNANPTRARDKPEAMVAVEDLKTSRLPLSLDGAQVKGSALAPVILLEFADFECPFCARFALETLDKLQDEFVSTGRVQYGFRHAPLRMHKLARPAAQSAECAARQGKFWDAHDYLFRNRERLALALALSLRTDNRPEIDAALFEKCLAEPAQARIDTDAAEASRFKIEATPTFIVAKRGGDGSLVAFSRINGNQPYDVFKEALNRAAAVGPTPNTINRQ
jgi:protein-disulfide isomerase